MATINDRPRSSNSPPVESKKRREVIKKLAIGTAALTGCSLLPDKWATPLVEFGALPAHATTSGLTDELISAIKEAEQATASPQQVVASSPTAATTAEEETAAQQSDEAENADSDAGWTTIHWGGNPNASGDNRDVTWWTKIHGETWPYWHRKFPLPRWLDDKAYRIRFEFSDGVKFTVYNSQRMEMDSNGPKYMPEQPGEIDPRKQHPKIGVLLHTNPNWVRFKTF